MTNILATGDRRAVSWGVTATYGLLVISAPVSPFYTGAVRSEGR
jgi:hypothetical protein